MLTVGRHLGQQNSVTYKRNKSDHAAIGASSCHKHFCRLGGWCFGNFLFPIIPPSHLSDSCSPFPLLHTPASELWMKRVVVVYFVQTGIPSPRVWWLTFVLCEGWRGAARKGRVHAEWRSMKSITGCFLTPFQPVFVHFPSPRSVNIRPASSQKQQGELKGALAINKANTRSNLGADVLVYLNLYCGWWVKDVATKVPITWAALNQSVLRWSFSFHVNCLFSNRCVVNRNEEFNEV